MGTTTPGVITEPLWAGEAGRAKYKYDPTKLIHLGSAQAATYNCYVRADAPAKTIQEAMTTEVILGANAEGGSTRDAPVLLNNVLGTKFRIVTGYPGTREILIAMERNEVHGTLRHRLGCDATASARIGSRRGLPACWCRRTSPAIRCSTRWACRAPSTSPRPPEARQIIELAYTQQAFGRPYILPPGTPADRVAALRKAFMAATQNAELLAEAEKMRVEVRPVVGRGHRGAGQQDVRAAARSRRTHARRADLQAAEIERDSRSCCRRLTAGDGSAIGCDHVMALPADDRSMR